MDKSVTRRGHSCWYYREEVGYKAVNDACILESTVYKLVRQHFKGEPFYVDLLEIFQDVRIRYLRRHMFAEPCVDNLSDRDGTAY